MRYPFAILLLATCVFAQDASVTFYSAGSSGKTKLKLAVTLNAPGKNPFIGSVLDDGKIMAFLEPGRFITLRFSPGEHVFSVRGQGGRQRSPSEKERLPLVLEADHQYFARLTGAHKGFYTVVFFQGFVAQVDCETARQEASGTEPIKVKHVVKEVRDKLENVAYFPNCK